MDEFTRLNDAAFKAERSSARRLAARTGIAPADALKATLTASAGVAGLPALLAARDAHNAAMRARATARNEQQAAREAVRRHRHDGAPSPWRAWFDGSAHPNPGRCGIGALLEGPDGIRLEITEPAGHGSSSEAEYAALIAVLRAAVQLQSHGLTVYGDSRVVIDDATGAAAPAVSLTEQRNAARALLAQIAPVTLRWIPRHKNGAADSLSQRAIHAHPSS